MRTVSEVPQSSAPRGGCGRDQAALELPRTGEVCVSDVRAVCEGEAV